MENESLRKTGVSNTLGDVLSVMIFVAAVTFAGWYVYSRGVTVSDTSAQNAFDPGQWVFKPDAVTH